MSFLNYQQSDTQRNPYLQQLNILDKTFKNLFPFKWIAELVLK